MTQKQKFGLLRPSSVPDQEIQIKTRLEQPQAGMKSLGLGYWDILAFKNFGAIWSNFGHPFFIQIRKGLNFCAPLHNIICVQ